MLVHYMRCSAAGVKVDPSVDQVWTGGQLFWEQVVVHFQTSPHLEQINSEFRPPSADLVADEEILLLGISAFVFEVDRETAILFV